MECWKALVLHDTAHKADRAAADETNDCILQGSCRIRQHDVCKL